MKAVILGYGNRIDIAALSSDTTWETTLPLANIQSSILAKKARTTVADSFVLTVDLSAKAARSMAMVAIAGHNLSRTATVELNFYQGATLVFGSGAVSPWPYLVADDAHWSAHTFGYAIVDNERIAGMVPTFVYPLAEGIQANKLTVTVDDHSNAAGYVELGRVFVGDAFAPLQNVEYGDVSMAALDFSEIQTTKQRAKYFYKYPVIRTASVVWKHLNEAEVLGGVYAMQRTIGLTGEVVFVDGFPTYHTISGVAVPDSNWFAKAFLGNPTDLTALTYPNFSEYSGGFGIEEVAL